MRKAAALLGIIGGAFGIIFGLSGASTGGTVAALSVVGILLGVAAIVGGVLANSRRRASIILLLASGFCISAFWISSGILLIVAGILELASGKTTVVAKAGAARVSEALPERHLAESDVPSRTLFDRMFPPIRSIPPKDL